MKEQANRERRRQGLITGYQRDIVNKHRRMHPKYGKEKVGHD